MSTLVTMLRGINVGGQKKLSMETLREIFKGFGFTNIRTYVQSGNVVFESPVQEPSLLTESIETRIEHTCGFHVEVFIRQAQELKRILAGNPFLNDRHEDPSKLHVTFLYRPPTKSLWSQLTISANTVDEFARGELAIYLFGPNGYGKTKLSNSYFERKLGMPLTTRNWNTVNALYKMVME